MPATRTANGPAGVSVVSCVAPRPRTAAAAGEASTGTAAPAARPGPRRSSLAAGRGGYGVVAVTAA